jgi:hypothetical protein
MATINGEGAGVVRAPAYVAFKTFNTLIDDFKEHGVPQQIDRSVLRRFSGGVGSQLISALKALRLITEDNRPTPALQDLVNAVGTDEYKELIGIMLRSAYPYLVNLDLMTVTPAQFADAFKVTGAKEDVLRKARTFYLHAAQFAGVSLGSRLTAGSAPRRVAGSPGAPRRATKVKGTAPPPSPPPPSPPPPPMPISQPLEYRLIDLLKEADIGENESAAIWTLVRFLTAKQKAA